jgi:hypothetical protein
MAIAHTIPGHCSVTAWKSLGQVSAAAKTAPGCCPEISRQLRRRRLEIFPVAAWTLPGRRRVGAGQLPGKRRGSAAGQPVAGTALSDKGIVSHKTERLSIPESRKR